MTAIAPPQDGPVFDLRRKHGLNWQSTADMERLSFSSKFGYNASEAAIHMARYQLAAAYCKDKRVLDIACGEGYGSYALKRFGAASVEGVDNVPVAIETARRLFGAPGINYQVGDAEQVDGLFPPGEFDVVVSLETIEHLRDPAAFLRALKRVAKDDAVIIVSCPNDHWYYPGADQSNPFHVRKYAFEEFRSLTTEVLGADAVWGYGVPMVGFGNVMDDDIAGRDQMLGQAMMLDFTVQASAITLPQRQLANVGPRNCSYFVGIWGGGGEGLRSAAVSPISMDQYANLVSWEAATTSPRRVHELETAIENASLELASISQYVDRSTGDHATSAADQSNSSRREGDATSHLSSKIAGLRGTIAQLHGTIASFATISARSRARPTPTGSRRSRSPRSWTSSWATSPSYRPSRRGSRPIRTRPWPG